MKAFKIFAISFLAVVIMLIGMILGGIIYRMMDVDYGVSGEWQISIPESSAVDEEEEDIPPAPGPEYVTYYQGRWMTVEEVEQLPPPDHSDVPLGPDNSSGTCIVVYNNP